MDVVATICKNICFTFWMKKFHWYESISFPRRTFKEGFSRYWKQIAINGNKRSFWQKRQEHIFKKSQVRRKVGSSSNIRKNQIGSDGLNCEENWLLKVISSFLVLKELFNFAWGFELDIWWWCWDQIMLRKGEEGSIDGLSWKKNTFQFKLFCICFCFLSKFLNCGAGFGGFSDA